MVDACRCTVELGQHHGRHDHVPLEPVGCLQHRSHLVEGSPLTLGEHVERLRIEHESAAHCSSSM